MMTNVQYLLSKLAEEAAEIAQIALKAQQFGLDEIYQVETNKQRTHKELNDLLGVLFLLNQEEGFAFEPNQEAIQAKVEKILEYRQYAVDLGMVNGLPHS